MVNLRPKVQGSIGGFGVSRFVGFTPVAGARADLWQKPLENNLTKLADSLGALSPTLTKLLQTQQGMILEEERTDVQKTFARQDAATKRRLSELDAREWEAVDSDFAGDNPWRKVFIQEIQGKRRAEVDLYDSLSQKVGELSDPKRDFDEVTSEVETLASSLRPEGTFAGRAYDASAAQVLQQFNAQNKSRRASRQQSDTAEAYTIDLKSAIGHALRQNGDLNSEVFSGSNQRWYNVTGDSGRGMAFEVFNSMAEDHLSVSTDKADALADIMAAYANLKDVTDGSGARWGAIETPEEELVFMEKMEKLAQAEIRVQGAAVKSARLQVEEGINVRHGEVMDAVDRLGVDKAFDEYYWPMVLELYAEHGDLLAVDAENGLSEKRAFREMVLGDRSTLQAPIAAEEEARADAIDGMNIFDFGAKWRSNLSPDLYKSLTENIVIPGYDWKSATENTTGITFGDYQKMIASFAAAQPSIGETLRRNAREGYDRLVDNAILAVHEDSNIVGVEAQRVAIIEMVRDGLADSVAGGVASVKLEQEGTVSDMLQDPGVRGIMQSFRLRVSGAGTDFSPTGDSYPEAYEVVTETVEQLLLEPFKDGKAQTHKDRVEAVKAALISYEDGLPSLDVADASPPLSDQK